MVQALTAAAIVLTATTVLAAPIFDETLVSREPAFWNTVKNDLKKVGSGLEKGITGVANTVGTVAQGLEAANAVKSGYSSLRGKREEEIADLLARDPSFGSFIKGIGKDIGKVAGVVAPIATKFIREEPQELSARDIELLEELAARDPSFGSFFKGLAKDVGKVASVATKFIREEPIELSERDIEIMEELAARDPSFGSFFKGLAKDVGKVAGVVAPIATKFIREEPLELSARDIELLEELAARDPSFGSFFKGLAKDVGKVAGAVAPIATKFIREEPLELSARDMELLEELAARDPSFGSFIKGIGKDIGKVAGVVAPIATKFIREEPSLDALD